MKSRNMAKFKNLSDRRKMQGTVLLVGLVMLIVLTLLAFSALRSATLQERMSGNLRDRGIAFQAAESALRAAEKYLADNPSPPSATFTGTACSAKGVFKLVSGVPYFAQSGSAFSSGTVWDGASTDFWSEYPWEAANCSFNGSGDNITYVAQADLGKPGKPIKLPRYVIEEMPSDVNDLTSYRVTAIGWGSSENSEVVLQATYTSQ